METINDRITASRQAQKISKAELARRIGITHASVSKWESGLNQPKGRYLNDLAAALGVSVDWLLTGNDEAPAAQVKEPLSGYHNVEPAVIPKGSRVPIISYVQAGHWREMCEQATAFDGNVEYVTASVDVGPRGFGLWLRGNSMEPRFSEGDLLIADIFQGNATHHFVVVLEGRLVILADPPCDPAELQLDNPAHHRVGHQSGARPHRGDLALPSASRPPAPRARPRRPRGRGRAGRAISRRQRLSADRGRRRLHGPYRRGVYRPPGLARGNPHPRRHECLRWHRPDADGGEPARRALP